MRNRFAKADSVKLQLSDGDWIEIKSRLTVGERERLKSYAIRGVATDVGDDDTPAGKRRELVVDGSLYSIFRLKTWLLRWSLTDADNKAVEITMDTIASLDPESFDEIESAINRHIKEQEKNAKSATNTSA